MFPAPFTESDTLPAMTYPDNPDTPVRVSSIDDRTFTFEYRSGAYGSTDRYRLNPFETVFWPWKVACHLLGNPLLNDTDADQAGRREIRRIQIERGIFSGSWDEFAEVRPRVDVYDMAGEKLRMKQDFDPYAEDIAEPISPQTMQDRMAALEAELALLRANVDPAPSDVIPALTPNAPDHDAPTDASTLPDDDTSIPAPATPTQPRLSGQPRDTPLRVADLGVDLPVDK